MKILALDTSAKTAAAAVVQEDKILCRTSVTVNLTHSQTLLPLCDAMLKAAGMSLKEMDLFAVSAGPGSFTGLRIGIGAIKGMAQGLNKPCVGVSTLEALSCNYMGLEGLTCCRHGRPMPAGLHRHLPGGWRLSSAPHPRRSRHHRRACRASSPPTMRPSPLLGRRCRASATTR